MKNENVLVIGANGTVGSELVKLLKKDGYQVRAATSQPINDPKEQVQVNLVTGEGVNQAFENIDRLFMLSPPGYTDQYALLSPLVQEAKRRGLKKVVLMTAMGANANEQSPFRRLEVELEKSGLSYNIIRPNWFSQNFHTFWIGGIQSQSKILLPAGNAKVSFIDARDIAATAFTLLTTDKHERQAFDLTGPESITHADVAKILSEVSGRKIVYEEISSESFVSGLKSAGIPEGYADFLGLIMGFLKEGYSERRTTSVKDITGKSPHTFADYARDHKAKFKI